MTLKDRLTKLGGSFAPAVAVLVGGTALGHAITAAAMPVLTRLYTPADFGLLAVFSAVFAILTVAVCLRYEITIALPESDDDAINLLAIAIGAGVAISAVIALAVLLWAPAIGLWLGQPSIAPYLWMLPVTTLMAGVFAPLQCWLVRQREFGSLARIRIGQSAAASGSQIVLGIAGVAPFGLLAGPLVNSMAGGIGGVLRMWRLNRGALRAVSAHRMRSLGRAYSAFPRYSAAEALANSASIQLPVMLIAALGSSAEAGHLMLAMFVVHAPMALLGSAVSQVYLSRAPDELRAGTLNRFTAEVIGGLLRTGVGPLVALGVVAPFVFAPLFGEAWARAGIITAWLTPWFVVHFLAAPISVALHIAGRLRIALALQFFGLALRVGAVFCAAKFTEDRLTETYALTGFLFYIAYLILLLRVTACRRVDLVRAARSAAPSCATWLGVAIPVAIAAYTLSLYG